MKLSGAKALVKSLEDEGVEIVFGIPGGVVLPFFDALYDSKMRKVLTRHEQGAAHMADGYARATGRVGVCISTSGPGATNLVTGIANAYMDSIPMIAITGQVASHMIGTDAFQEADTTGITLPIVKHNYLIKDAAEITDVMQEAFYIARTGRPGPVVIDVPVDIFRGEVNYSRREAPQLKGYKPTYKGHKKQIRLAAKAILESAKPVLYVGGGLITSDASAELKKLATGNNIYVTHTLMGKGVFPESNRLSLGMLGMHGTRAANYAVCETDLIIAAGVRFDDRITGKLSEFAPNAKVIHMDIDPAEISKNVQANIPIVGDARQILRELNTILKEIRHEVETPDRKPWNSMIEEWKAKYPLTYEKNSGLKPQFVVEKIYEITKGDAIICTEVGQNQMWAAQYYKMEKPRRFITSGGLGTMGFGFPAAIGAQLGKPKDLVIDIAGDGSFQMTMQEMATAVLDKAPVKVAVLNNGYLGMVRQWQQLFYGRKYSSSCLRRGESPDLVALAEAFGAKGILVTDPEMVEPAIKEAIDTDCPVLIDFHVEEEENVYPMVAPGAPLYDMIGDMLYPVEKIDLEETEEPFL
ncbi:MAG: acetolactate synthase, large subunit, biosynthetic type [Candidatus Solincola sediminis]|uniref:Acetolactate synthase n=1 Tax=Candidatus Solincola sediminis TaxID=1797199 RepID=A0A1F2WH80_9ACTN|nr:MAG: acetolactate synthase, large subunit, biosynthetic type [Candidatus Solincola sediminis]